MTVPTTAAAHSRTERALARDSARGVRGRPKRRVSRKERSPEGSFLICKTPRASVRSRPPNQFAFGGHSIRSNASIAEPRPRRQAPSAAPGRRVRRRGGAKQQVPRSPDATQRRQFSPPHHPQCPLGPPWCVNATPRLADRATARAFARRRTPQNGRAGGLGGARGRRGGEKDLTADPKHDPRTWFPPFYWPAFLSFYLHRTAPHAAPARMHARPLARTPTTDRTNDATCGPQAWLNGPLHDGGIRSVCSPLLRRPPLLATPIAMPLQCGRP